MGRMLGEICQPTTESAVYSRLKLTSSNDINEFLRRKRDLKIAGIDARI